MSPSINLFVRYIGQHFEQADKNKDGDLSLEECMKIAKQLNVKLSKAEIETHFKVSAKLFSEQSLFLYSV